MYVCKGADFAAVFCRYGVGGHTLSAAQQQCNWICVGRTGSRTLAYCFCLRYLIFFCGGFCRIRRPVRMEFWYFQHLDWTGKRLNWQPACMGGIRASHPYYDKASGILYYAGLFCKTLSLQDAADCGLADYFYLPNPLFCFGI